MTTKRYKAAWWGAALALLLMMTTGCQQEQEKWEDWPYEGKLYRVFYGSNGVTTVYLLGPDHELSTIIDENSTLFSDITDSVNETRDDRFDDESDPTPTATKTGIRAGRGEVYATGKPKVVNHMLSPAGAWVRRFNPAANQLDRVLQVSCSGALENGVTMAVSADNSVGVVLTYAPTLQQYCAAVFDPRAYKLLGKATIPSPARANGVVIAPDARRAYVIADYAASGPQSTLYPLDLAAMKLGQPMAINQPRLTHLAMTPDGERIYMVGSNSFNSIPVLDVATETQWMLPIKPIESITPHSMVMHPYGHKLYIFSDYNKRAMNVVDTATGKVTGGFVFPDYNVVGATTRANPQFTPDGRYLFAASQTETVMIDTQDDTVLKRIPHPTPAPTGQRGIGVFFIPDVN
ncbi:MAG: hypothetical protein HY821_24135 [Acidobacteria bacterium]|nr:hypothetical protein [Acidobacteriota bacterium]